MKRLICAVLVLIFLLEASPIEAMAESAGMITAEELAEAWALTGLDEDAAGYHEGMDVDGAMNAMQLAGWVDDLLDHEMNTLGNIHTDLEQAIAEMQARNDGSYQRLIMSNEGQNYLNLSRELYAASEDLREQLRWHKDQLENKSGRIRYMIDSLSEGQLTKAQKLRYSETIRAYTQDLKDIRNEITNQADTWDASISNWRNTLNGRSASNDPVSAGLGDWISQVMNDSAPAIQTSSVRASTLYPDNGGTSLLGRISPIRSALAEEDDLIHVIVLDDRYFVLTVKDDDSFVKGAAIILRDQLAEEKDRVDIAAVTDDYGNATFETKDFIQDDDGTMTVSMYMHIDGYREIFVGELDIARGTQYFISANDKVENPYIKSMDFNGHDIMLSEFNAYFSSENHLQHDINVKVIHQAPVKVTMTYTDVNNLKELKSKTINLPRRNTKGESVAVFEDYWKKILAPGKEVNITLSEDSGFSETVVAKLTMVQAEYEQPFLDSGNKLLGSLVQDMGFGFTIPESVGEPFGGSRLSLENIPILEKYMPHVSVDIAGYAMISIGSTPKEDPLAKWETKDQKELDAIQEKNEKDGNWKANKVAGGMFGLIQTQPTAFLGVAKADVTFFATLFGRWPQMEDGQYDIHVGGSIGAALTLGAEFTWTNGGFFVSAGVTASLAVALGLGAEIVTDENLKYKRLTLDFGQTGVTIFIRITVTLSVGLGLKGVASVAAVGSASFNIVILLTASTLLGSTALSVSFDASVDIVFEILWIKYSINVWNYNKQIYPPESKAVSLLASMSARANEEEEPEPQKGEIGRTPLSVESFPDLRAELTTVCNYDLVNSQVRYINLNNVPFMLYIKRYDDVPYPGGCWVTWVNLESSETGTFQLFLVDHGFERYPIDEGFMPGIKVKRPIDYAFDVRRLEDDTSKALLAFLRTYFMDDQTVTMDDGTEVTYQKPRTSKAFIMGITEKDGRLIPAEGQGDERLPVVYSFDTEEKFGYLGGGISIGDFRIVNDRSVCSVSVQEYLPYDQNELTAARRIGVVGISQKDAANNLVQYKKDEDRDAPKEGTVRTSQTASVPITCKKDQISLPIYALETDPSKPDNRTLTMDGGYFARTELDNGNIVYYDMISTQEISFYQGHQNATATDYLLYLVREEVGEDAERTVLKGLKCEKEYTWTIIDPIKGDAWLDSKMKVLMTDFDIAVPTQRFDMQKIYGNIYLYWLETGVKEKDDDPDITRLSGVIFDPISNICMGKYVLAEFESSQLSGSPSHIFLGADGKGYFMAAEVSAANGQRATLYSFPLQIVPSVEIATTVLDSNVVKPGAFLDINIGLMNKGNTPISVFDVQAVLGEDEVFETMHMDIEHPENNRITAQDGTAIELSGEHTFYRLENSGEPMVQSAWTLYGVEYEVASYTGQHDNQHESRRYVTTDMLMPGAFTGYKTALKIPANWEGGEKDINLRYSAIAVPRNFVRAAALNSGAMDASLLNLNDGSLGQIEYTLNSRGTALERAASPANAEGDAALYASSVSVGTPKKLNHDIHEIEVFHRVYDDPNGVERITITIVNQAETHDHLQLYAELYPDRAEEPFYLDLPYYEDSTSHGKTQNIDMAMSTLLGGRTCRELRVVIKAKGVKETGLLDNEFILHFGDDDINDPLRFTLQPADRLAMAGETVVFTVAVAGGYPPYTYQWQVNRGLGMGREDIAGATDEQLTVKDVTEEMDGWLYRCVARDHNRNTATSESAALHLKKTPATGDGSSIIWYLVIALSAAALYLLLRRRRLQAGQRKQ